MRHASLCFLSFERPDFVQDAIRSAVENADAPCEVIVHDDGSTDPHVAILLLDLLHEGMVHRLILNQPGHNEGVGAAFNRCAKLATGDPVVKLDQDLLFEPGWLRKAVSVVEADDSLCGLGLFKYHVEPCRWQDMELGPGEPLGEMPAYHYVKDHVSSAIVMPRRTLMPNLWPEHSAAYAEDVEWKRAMQERGFKLAVLDEDVATNRGFGIGPSTVVLAAGTVREIKTGSRVHP